MRKKSRLTITLPKDLLSKIDSNIDGCDINDGFISNLSIIDLLFNEGVNTFDYLESVCQLLVIARSKATKQSD